MHLEAIHQNFLSQGSCRAWPNIAAFVVAGLYFLPHLGGMFHAAVDGVVYIWLWLCASTH